MTRKYDSVGEEEDWEYQDQRWNHNWWQPETEEDQEIPEDYE